MKILFAGDFVAQERVKVQIEKGDFSCIEAAKAITDAADYSIVNFESPVLYRKSKPIAKGGPNFRSTEKALKCVIKNGFDCVTLANNHFRDYGQIGVEDTISACENLSVDYVGGGADLESSQSILYVEINNTIIAIINFCENEFSIATDTRGGSAPFNLVSNCRKIVEGRENADYVIVIVHGGVEHYPLPTPRMQDAYRFFVEQGADIVVNHHQHCFGGYEIYKKKPIFYGLGNFCFDRPDANDLWHYGYMVLVNITKDDISFDLHPYSQGTLQHSDVLLLSGKERDNFYSRIDYLNSIISDPQKVKLEFEKYVNSNCRSRLLLLEPFQNRLLRRLQSKGLLPRLIKGPALISLYDRMNCESQRDVYTNIMLKEIK